MTRPTQQILDRVRAKLGGISDYQAARELGVTQQAVSLWRSGRSIMGDEPAIAAAAILGEKPEVIMALLAADRTQSEKAKKLWTNLARQLRAGTAVAIVGTIGITGFQQTTHAAAALTTSSECILC
ncbi:MAG: DUF3693 domain-containing protein [Pseudomonadota bacterium]|nr:DUF3693 domain-containing protein [Pseudomonadota bacterium]